MKKFMQVGLFMGTFLLSSQLFAQTVEKRGEYPVCPAKKEKSDAPKTKSSLDARKNAPIKANYSTKISPAGARRSK